MYISIGSIHINVQKCHTYVTTDCYRPATKTQHYLHDVWVHIRTLMQHIVERSTFVGSQRSIEHRSNSTRAGRRFQNRPVGEVKARVVSFDLIIRDYFPEP